MTSTSPGWTILVPVKDTARGKSRIDLPAELRRRLALAMALDTVTAAAHCGSVMAIVESEADAVALAAVPGVLAHRTGVTGLNESIRDGIKALSGSGLATDRVAVLPGDLPGLRHQELSAVLHECAAHRFSVVADHQGVGHDAAGRHRTGRAGAAVRAGFLSPPPARRRRPDRPS